ncbi:MAG TPA: PilN domain-containing protein [Rhodocyclaceae bacterium]|nr:PilN domain-containing protein [Rhodocyclaceae bacterium]
MDARAQQINLYNPALRRQRVWLTLGNVLVLAALFGLGLVAAGLVLHRQAAARQATVQALETRLVAARAETFQLGAALSGDAASAAAKRELAELRQQLATRSEVLAALQGGAGIDSVRGQSTVGFADYLRGLARQTVSGLWLTGFSVAQGGGGMEVRGRMLAVDRLPEYIKRLNGEVTFKGRQFVSLNISRADKASTGAAGTPYSAFVLTATPEAKDAARNQEAAR